MAIVSLENILERMKKFQPDDLSDDYLSILEDLSDTVNGKTLEEELDKLRKSLDEAIEAKNETDRVWRQKYTDRFLGKSVETFGEQEAQDLEKDETVEVKSLEEVAEEWEESKQ